MSAVATTGAARADDACDLACYDGQASSAIVSPPDGSTVPTNVRILVDGTDPLPVLVDASATSVALERHDAPPYAWLDPVAGLAASSAYSLTDGVDTRWSGFSTGAGPDDVAPVVSSASVTAARDGCVETLAVTLQGVNEDVVIVELSFDTPRGKEHVFRAGVPTSSFGGCRRGGKGEAFEATVTVYDLAGNPATPATASVEPGGWDDEQDGGCSVRAPRPSAGAPCAVVGALGLVVGARRMRRVRGARSKPSVGR